MTAEHNAVKLQKLATQIIERGVCEQLAAQATQLVMGSGDPNADIVIIGEAPGKQEDIQGEPFVGTSGKFLDEMLRLADMKRPDVYITNSVGFGHN